MKQFLKSMIITKKKKKIKKTLVMSEENEKWFQSNKKCWICNKLFVDEYNKVRDHDHVIEKYRGSAHWSFNIILELKLN